MRWCCTSRTERVLRQCRCAEILARERGQIVLKGREKVASHVLHQQFHLLGADALGPHLVDSGGGIRDIHNVGNKRILCDDALHNRDVPVGVRVKRNHGAVDGGHKGQGKNELHGEQCMNNPARTMIIVGTKFQSRAAFGVFQYIATGIPKNGRNKHRQNVNKKYNHTAKNIPIAISAIIGYAKVMRQLRVTLKFVYFRNSPPSPNAMLRQTDIRLSLVRRKQAEAPDDLFLDEETLGLASRSQLSRRVFDYLNAASRARFDEPFEQGDPWKQRMCYCIVTRLSPNDPGVVLFSTKYKRCRDAVEEFEIKRTPLYSMLIRAIDSANLIDEIKRFLGPLSLDAPYHWCCALEYIEDHLIWRVRVLGNIQDEHEARGRLRLLLLQHTCGSRPGPVWDKK